LPRGGLPDQQVGRRRWVYSSQRFSERETGQSRQCRQRLGRAAGRLLAGGAEGAILQAPGPRVTAHLKRDLVRHPVVTYSPPWYPVQLGQSRTVDRAPGPPRRGRPCRPSLRDRLTPTR